MSLIKEGHMSQFKAGKMKDKEQFVNCKLISYGVGERPEIQVFTDGSSKKPYSILKVKSFAAVCESDQVPKIVKAKYDNYICITASGTGGKPTYLRTDTREQRDEWCRELQALINLKAESKQQVTPQQPLQPHRERTRTDATSNRPPISRGRKGNTLNTAPGTMIGTFHDELNKVVKKRNNLAEVTEEVADCQICCDRHHLEHGLPHDAHCQATYQNVHHVANVDEWRRQQQSSKQALKETQELYNDFHQTSMIQVRHDEPENEYETPEFRRDPLPDSSYRLSGCSTSSEESASGSQAMSLPQSLHSCKEPVESSWPPSPESSAEDSEPEYPEGNPPTSLTRTLPELSRVREPEASLCVQEEQVYENTFAFQRRPRTGSKPPPLPRSASLRTESTPKLPPRKSSLPTAHQPVPPKLPEKNPAVKIEAQSRKLKDERLVGTAIVRMSKTTLVRNLSCLSLKKTNDCIIITKVPCELKDYFRVGDQWLKVNDAFLNGVQFAHDCVQMSDKLEIEITLKRIPFGRICEFPWTSNDVDDIGLTLCGNGKKRRSVDSPCSSVLVQSLLYMIIAVATILAGSPVLVAGSTSNDQVSLQAGESTVIPFILTWPSIDKSHADPHFTLRFESKPRPFCINGHLDLEGFKSPSQFPRFNTSVERLATSLNLNLFIESVDTLDQDMYILSIIHYDFQNVFQKTFRKEVLVHYPPGPAKCFITLSENNNYPYKVHCQATTGNIETTLTCYQFSQRVEVEGGITDNGQVTRGVFLLPDNTPFSCCSHDVNFNVNEKVCNDFEWLPIQTSIDPPTANDSGVTPSVANANAAVGNSEQASKTASSVFLTMSMMIYLFLCC